MKQYKKLILTLSMAAGIISSADAQTTKQTKVTKDKVFANFAINTSNEQQRSLAEKKIIVQSYLKNNPQIDIQQELWNTWIYVVDFKDSVTAKKFIADMKVQGINFSYEVETPFADCTTPLFVANDFYNDMWYWNSVNMNLLPEKQNMDSIYHLLKPQFRNYVEDAGETVDMHLTEIPRLSHRDLPAFNLAKSNDFLRNWPVNAINSTVHWSWTAWPLARTNNAWTPSWYNGGMAWFYNVNQPVLSNVWNATSGFKSAQLAAMQHAINQANATGRFQILSFSFLLTTWTDSDFDAMFAQADANGKVIFIIWAWNNAAPIWATYAANHPSVLIAQASNWLGVRAWFSNYNAWISFNWESTRWISNADDQSIPGFNGTSASTPNVASLTALLTVILKQTNPNITAAEVTAMIKDPKNTTTMILNPSWTLTPSLRFGYLLHNQYFSIVKDYPNVINASTTPTINLTTSTHDVQGNTISTPTYWYRRNQTGPWLEIFGWLMNLNEAWNGTHDVKIEFKITHNQTLCTQIIRQIQVSNAVAVTPWATAPTASASTICSWQGSTLTANFTNMGSAPTFQWFLNGNAISGATSSTYTYNNATAGDQSFTVVITPTPGGTYTNPNPVTSPATVVTVSQSATPTGDIWPNTLATCENTATSLTYAFANNNGVAYTHEHHLINPAWQDNIVGNINPWSITTPVLTPWVWKSYIKSIRQWANTCASPTVFSDTASITVNQLPSSPTSSVQQPSCSVATGQITVTNWGAWFTYSFDNGATWGSSNVSPALPAGTYQVKVRNASGCQSSAVAVTINSSSSAPVVWSIMQTGNVISIPAIPGATYQWQLATNQNGPFVNIPNATWLSHSILQTWFYKVVVTVQWCTWESAAINAVITAIDPDPTVPNNWTLKIYPNPVKRTFTIDSLPLNITWPVKVGIYDAMWRNVFLAECVVQQRKAIVQLPQLASWIYYVRVQDKNKLQWMKWSHTIVVSQ
jgi:hypothetical protein